MLFLETSDMFADYSFTKIIHKKIPDKTQKKGYRIEEEEIEDGITEEVFEKIIDIAFCLKHNQKALKDETEPVTFKDLKGWDDNEDFPAVCNMKENYSVQKYVSPEYGIKKWYDTFEEAYEAMLEVNKGWIDKGLRFPPCCGINYEQGSGFSPRAGIDLKSGNIRKPKRVEPYWTKLTCCWEYNLRKGINGKLDEEPEPEPEPEPEVEEESDDEPEPEPEVEDEPEPEPEPQIDPEVEEESDDESDDDSDDENEVSVYCYEYKGTTYIMNEDPDDKTWSKCDVFSMENQERIGTGIRRQNGKIKIFKSV
tara:strand:- start:2895 stop:3821 length:927 start_codon:yes stop_codon:yes gene_type:complete